MNGCEGCKDLTYKCTNFKCDLSSDERHNCTWDETCRDMYHGCGLNTNCCLLMQLESLLKPKKVSVEFKGDQPIPVYIFHFRNNTAFALNADVVKEHGPLKVYHKFADIADSIEKKIEWYEWAKDKPEVIEQLHSDPRYKESQAVIAKYEIKHSPN